MKDVEKILLAAEQERAQASLGTRAPVDMTIQEVFVPAGGDWQILMSDGSITRKVVWGRFEVAQVNPAGDFTDAVEEQLARGFSD